MQEILVFFIYSQIIGEFSECAPVLERVCTGKTALKFMQELRDKQDPEDEHVLEIYAQEVVASLHSRREGCTIGFYIQFEHSPEERRECERAQDIFELKDIKHKLWKRKQRKPKYIPQRGGY